MTRRGFTLIELMVALCIIGILSTIALPSVRRMRSAAEAAALVERLHLIRDAFIETGLNGPNGLYSEPGEVPPRLSSLLPETAFRGEGGLNIRIAGSRLAHVGVMIRAETPTQRLTLEYLHRQLSPGSQVAGSWLFYVLIP